MILVIKVIYMIGFLNKSNLFSLFGKVCIHFYFLFKKKVTSEWKGKIIE